MKLVNTPALEAGLTEGECLERGVSFEKGQRGSSTVLKGKLPGLNGLSQLRIDAGHGIRIEDVGEMTRIWRN